MKMKLKIKLLSLCVVLWLLLVVQSLKFGQICSGNPTNARRSSDRYGQGHYGARRGDREHKGVDVVCTDGAEVLAPFDLDLSGALTVYTDPKKSAINQGINLRGEGLCVKLFYVAPDRTTGRVRKGQRIGVLLPMQMVYPGITSHVHVQLCDKSNPTQYF